MNEQCESQEARLARVLNQPWPPCAQDVIAAGKRWKIVAVNSPPDNIRVGSTIMFSNSCEDTNNKGILNPTLDTTSCYPSAEPLDQIMTAWGDVGLKYCADYNALTGKLNIPNSNGVAHPHTVTIRISGAKTLYHNKPVIICEYDDDVWNGPGSWEAL